MKNKSLPGNKLNRIALFGFAIVVIFISCTIIAILLFPGSVSPYTVYLSKLGNANISPKGSIFFNLGAILSGFVEIIFYVSIFIYYINVGRKWWLTIGLLSGVINGISILMVGVYSQNININAHITWSYLVFFSFIPLLISYNVVFWKNTKMSIAISLSGFFDVIVDILLLATILGGGLEPGIGSIMEWVTIFSYLAWVLLISINIIKITTV
jgi:hypothetical protein